MRQRNRKTRTSKKKMKDKETGKQGQGNRK